MRIRGSSLSVLFASSGAAVTARRPFAALGSARLQSFSPVRVIWSRRDRTAALCRAGVSAAPLFQSCFTTSGMIARRPCCQSPLLHHTRTPIPYRMPVKRKQDYDYEQRRAPGFGTWTANDIIIYFLCFVLHAMTEGAIIHIPCHRSLY